MKRVTMLLAAVSVAVAALVTMAGAASASWPQITMSQSMNTGVITVQGSGFTPSGSQAVGQNYADIYLDGSYAGSAAVNGSGNFTSTLQGHYCGDSVFAVDEAGQSQSNTITTSNPGCHFHF